MIVEVAQCHPDTCVDVFGANGHHANVNPIGFSELWRVDCDSCYTCIRSNLSTKEEAIEEAKKHVATMQDQSI